jgi:ankyrin repeat protein
LNKRIISFNSDIHQSALVGDLAALQRSIYSGVNINLAIDLSQDDYFYLRQLTPLMVAAMSNQGASVETVRWLVEHGADLNAKSAAQYTAIWYALAFWYIDDEEKLRVDRTNPDLMLEQAERLRYLLDLSTDLNLESLFCQACYGGAVSAVKLLLDYGASAVVTLVPIEILQDDKTDRWLDYPDVPIVLTAESGIVECAQLLLDAGADPNSYDNLGNMVLSVATTPAVVNLLIFAGADVHAHRIRHGDDDIFAECHPDRQILEILVAAGVDIEARNKYGWTRLYSAAFDGDLLRVEFLLAHGAKIYNCSTEDALDTPLHALCFCSGCVPIIDLFLDAGIDINAQNAKGNTPLLTAASQSYGCGSSSSDGALPTLVTAFIARGANVNLSNHRGETPLIATVKGCCFLTPEFECFKLLLAAGANLHHRDLDGKTAIDYFREIASICSRIEDGEILSYWETLDSAKRRLLRRQRLRQRQRSAVEIDYDI